MISMEELADLCDLAFWSSFLDQKIKKGKILSSIPVSSLVADPIYEAID